MVSLKKTLVWYVQVVPGGILVCFPNYDVMKLAYQLWGEERLEDGKVYFHNRMLFREFPDKNL